MVNYNMVGTYSNVYTTTTQQNWNKRHTKGDGVYYIHFFYKFMGTAMIFLCANFKCLYWFWYLLCSFGLMFYFRMVAGVLVHRFEYRSFVKLTWNSVSLIILRHFNGRMLLSMRLPLSWPSACHSSCVCTFSRQLPRDLVLRRYLFGALLRSR